MINVIPTPKKYTEDKNGKLFFKGAIYTDNENWKIYCDNFIRDFYSVTDAIPMRR